MTGGREEIAVVVRPFATPFPLSFFGLAGATTVAGALELGVVPASETTQAAVAILVFAPLPQLIGSLLGFAGRDAVAATGMGLLSVSWAAVGLDTLVAAPGTRSAVLGMLLFVSATGLTLSAWVAAREKLVPAAVMAVAALRFAVTGVYETAGSTGWETAAGIVGFVLAALAVYAAVALEVEDALRRPVAATLCRGEGLAALEGDLACQMRDVAREPGVRKRL